MLDKKHLNILLFSGVLLFLLMAYLSIHGPRGSDQFWYIQETETLLKIGKPISSNYYAGLYWRNGFNELNNYFIHHGLVHYVVLPLASIFGAYAGWIATSVLSVLLGTCLLILAVYNATNSYKLAIFTGIIFLFLPITIWQSFNILQESIIAAYMCLGVWIWERSINEVQNKFIYNVLGGFFGAVGVFIHPIFSIWCLGWMIQLFIFKEKIYSWRLWAPLFLTTCLLVFAQIYKNIFFPSNFFPTIGSIISNNSMTYYYDYSVPNVTIVMIMGKILSALKSQFEINNISIIFFYPFNLLLVLFLVSIGYRYKKDKSMALRSFILPIFLLVGFMIMIFLHQNQFRYSIIITPIILVSTVILFNKLIENKFRGISAFCFILALLSIFIITDIYLSSHIAKDARAHEEIIEKRKQGMPVSSDGQRVLIVFEKSDLSLLWSLYPRPILFLPVSNLQAPESVGAIHAFKPKYVIMQKTIKENVEESLPLQLKSVPFETEKLFKVINN